MLRKARRSPIALSKLLCATFILLFYVFYSRLNPPALTIGQPLPKRPSIQFEKWRNNTGKADMERRKRVREAMEHTFRGYRNKAWGEDDIQPVSGGAKNSRNGWGAFIVDSSTTLAVMGMWEELNQEITFIVDEIDFRMANGLVDPFETTIRYLGAIVSIVELGDSGIIPNSVLTASKREGILKKATTLAEGLLRAFEPSTGLSWPRIDFISGPEIANDPSIGPARAGSNFLELCTLSKLTKDPIYCNTATRAWAPLVRNPYFEEIPGLVDSRIRIDSGQPIGKERSWDSGHDSYYEYLIKANLLLPHSPNAKAYRDRWLQAAEAVRHNLTSRSGPSQNHAMSHLYMGKWTGQWYLNEMSHLACFAPGNLLLGGRHLLRSDLVALGQALLEGCRHVYKSSPIGLGPEAFSWEPAAGSQNATFGPVTERQHKE